MSVIAICFAEYSEVARAVLQGLLDKRTRA